MKKIALFMLVAVFFSSCTWLRERKAANHQPFKAHKDKPGKKYHKTSHK
jgi:hypothetical protein